MSKGKTHLHLRFKFNYTEDMPSSWKILSTKIIYKNHWLTLEESQVITPKGELGVYAVCETKPFVMIVAVKDDGVLMVKQFRFSIQRDTREYPAGFIDEGERPLDAAKRELLEETGYIAADWTSLGEIIDAVGIVRRKGYIFLARQLSRQTEELDKEDGVEDCFFVYIDDLRQKIIDGEVIDARIIAALCKARLLQLSC